MKYVKLLLLVFLFFYLSVPLATADDLQGVSYTITPTGKTDEYRISIEISNISAGGLSIEFPGNFEMTETDIPNGHYGSDAETLIVTLTGENEIYLDVICPNLATGEILETWENLAAGTKGGDELSVSESEKEQKTTGQNENVNQSENTAKESPFGFSGILIILSIVIAGFIVTVSNNHLFREEN